MRFDRSCILHTHLYMSRKLRCFPINTARRGLLRSAECHEKKSDYQKKLDGEAIASGSNADFIDRLFTKWSRDPNSVDESWRAFFSEKAPTQGVTSSKPPQRKPKKRRSGDGGGGGPGGPFQPTGGPAGPTVKAPQADWKYIDDHLTVQAIIRAYQTRGHLAADLDPLGIVGPTGKKLSEDNPKIDATKAVLCQHYYYQFNDLNAVFKLPSSTRIGGNEQFLPLQEILNRLERAYCGHIGVEYMSITSFRKSQWIREHFEAPGAIHFTNEEKKTILERLTRSTGFENFLAKKFVSEKRFGLEGCDIMIPVMKEIIDISSKLGVKSVLIGMAHRGRLNVLCNICRKPIVDLMTQFRGLKATDSGSGDVKYHLGLQITRLNRVSQKNVRYTLVANPSHLEFVNPVVLGKARAEMEERGDTKGAKVMPILIHGDASFCGQGVVYESIHMSDLPAYSTQGTIHIVANNQIGFTTDPRFSRSSRYCTDVARVVNAPIFHVNADDPEACIHCARVAAKWRATFHKDVVIDLVGYRRNGHNETDEPMFTQPLMYQRIRKMKTVTLKYAEQLARDGVIQMAEYDEMNKKYEKICNDAYEEAKKKKDYKHSDWLDSPWVGFFQGRNRLKVCPTGVDLKIIYHIARIYSSPPPEYLNFALHRGITRILEARKKMIEECTTDWSLGEAFAIGTLVKDKVHVRLSGQDVERGTFSHRHHVLHHQNEDKKKYISLQHLYSDQAAYDVSNSSLSECAIMGFDLGYSMASPNNLVIWEGQFGDFANTAQPIIDTFIASGETKWVRQSALCLFLPHSMEGMGPEHSSGRIERFLQLSDDDESVHPDTCDPDFATRQLMNINWIITNLTMPANLFHAMRRQMALGFRKPMINFSPKSLLRHPLARSPFKDYNECSCFHRVIPEEGEASQNPDCVKKLVFCSGKVYFDLLQERDDHEQNESVAISRVEQLCPFPYDLVEEEIAKYKKADIFWAQEEHKNQAAWGYVAPRFATALKYMEDGRCICYLGRPPNSASSTGNKVQHYKEQDDFITSVFGPLTEENKKRLEDIVKKKREAAIKSSEASIKAKKEKDAGAKGASGAPAEQPKKSQKSEETQPAARLAPGEKPKQAAAPQPQPEKKQKAHTNETVDEDPFSVPEPHSAGPKVRRGVSKQPSEKDKMQKKPNEDKINPDTEEP